MNEQEQKDGEKRVQALLIDPLERLGLLRPSGMSKAAFGAMQAELCQRLAYMTPQGLGALAVDMEGRAGGANKDRFPIATKVLERARLIEQPKADASPLIRKVFAERVGEEALRDGYAPDLMKWLRAHRTWPSPYVVGQLRDAARDAVRRVDALSRDVANSRDIARSDQAWLDARNASVERCKHARQLGLQDAETVGVQ